MNIFLSLDIKKCRSNTCRSKCFDVCNQEKDKLFDMLILRNNALIQSCAIILKPRGCCILRFLHKIYDDTSPKYRYILCMISILQQPLYFIFYRQIIQVCILQARYLCYLTGVFILKITKIYL